MSRLLLFLLALPLAAQYKEAQPEWNRPVEPFRVAGNIYYVGAHDVSAYVFTGSVGHILLDTGFHETVPLIEAGMKKLGLRFEDIKIVVTSHGHYDHVGGVAEVKRRTQARLLLNPVEAPLFARGGKGDFAFGDRFPYRPAEPDGALRDGVAVKLGDVSLTPHFTPGHTAGCTSWSTTVREGGKTYRVVIPCSMSAPGYKLVGNTAYPNVLRDFETSIAKLRAMPCDMYLALHGWDFDLENKRKQVAEGKGNPFLDAAALGRYLDRAEAALRKQAAESGKSQ